MMREYKSGMEWTFWRWTIRSEGFVRLHLVKTPWFAVCLHWLVVDLEPWLHDHPVTFLSIILRGWYIEWRDAMLVKRRWFNFVQAEDCHTIKRVAPGTITFVIMGPKVRNWGFWTNKGWVYWKDYYTHKLADAGDGRTTAGVDSRLP